MSSRRKPNAGKPSAGKPSAGKPSGGKPGAGRPSGGKPGADRRGGGRKNESGGRRSGQRGTTPIRSKPSGGGSGSGGGAPGGSSGGGAARSKGLGGDQVEGRQAVRELLMAGSRRTREVIFAAEMDQASILDEIRELARETNTTLREVSRNKFEPMARTDAPQGVIAFAAPLQPVSLDALARQRGNTPPFLLVLDGVTDPQNLGSILRVAECAGVTGIVLPRHRAARITPSVTKTAAGAIEHLPMAQVAGIPAALQRLKELEVWTVGLDMVADSTVFELRVATDPVALVLGAEGSGISRLVRERCDVVARIPLAGSLDSLNVSTAAAVACYEVVRRRES